MLMSYKWPAWYKGDPNADPYLVLGEIFEKAASFNTGLGISYQENALNQRLAAELSVVPGSRPPDVDLSMPGTGRSVRFQDITRNVARFWVVVFAGNVLSTCGLLRGLKKSLETTTQKLGTNEAVSWITISAVAGCSPYETLGMEPFGDTFYDATYSAHGKFGFSLEQGGVVILRPDGLLGTGGPIDGQLVKDYFAKILVSP